MRIAGAGCVCGRAVTAQCVEGSAGPILEEALADLAVGDLLCLAAPGDRASIGDLLVAELVRLGAVAVAVDGWVRDRARLRELGLGVFARGVTPRARHGEAVGRAQVPIAFGETVVAPGDWVVGDDDGVVAVPVDQLDGVLTRAEAMVERDERMQAAIASGTSLFDAWARETDR